MFPCIGQIVVPRADDSAHETPVVCRICGKPLTDIDQNLAKRVALCGICYDQSMKSMPHLTQ